MKTENNLNGLISKSLDELENLANSVGTEDAISKARDDEDINAGEVSDDAPAPEEAPEEGAPEEGAPEEGEADEQEDADADSEPEQDTDEDEEVEKSLESELRKSESSAKSLEVSTFLEDMTKSIDAVLASFKQDIRKSIESTQSSNEETLTKSVEGIFKSQETILKSHVAMHKSINALTERLESLEQQPVVRKSVSNKAQVVEKSFTDSIGVSNGNTGNTMSKSEASAKLMAEFSQGNQSLTNDILGLEAGKEIADLSENARRVLGL